MPKCSPAEFLAGRGLVIVERNWLRRMGRGVDLIARERRYGWWFVEVRLRRRGDFRRRRGEYHAHEAGAHRGRRQPSISRASKSRRRAASMRILLDGARRCAHRMDCANIFGRLKRGAGRATRRFLLQSKCSPFLFPQ